jgi:hypothetical protein
MTINRYRVEDIATGRTLEIAAFSADSARRKAWLRFGYEHIPFMTHQAAFRVRLIATETMAQQAKG